MIEFILIEKYTNIIKNIESENNIWSFLCDHFIFTIHLQYVPWLFFNNLYYHHHDAIFDPFVREQIYRFMLPWPFCTFVSSVATKT